PHPLGQTIQTTGHGEVPRSRAWASPRESPLEGEYGKDLASWNEFPESRSSRMVGRERPLPARPTGEGVRQLQPARAEEGQGGMAFGVPDPQPPREPSTMTSRSRSGCPSSDLSSPMWW